MKKIYRLDSDYINSEIDPIIDNLQKEIYHIVEDFMETLELIEFYQLPDGSYSKHDEGLNLAICILDDYEKEKFLIFINSIYDKNRYTIKDISESVLYGIHTEKDYLGVEEYVKKIFDNYLDIYLDQDTVLDKINIYGISSLNERDKKVLESIDI